MTSGVPTSRSEEVASELQVMVSSCLESARLEVLERFRKLGLPSSLLIERSRVVDNESDNGWHTTVETGGVSGLHDTRAMVAISDQSVPNMLLGLRAQLEPLAQLLDHMSDLATRPHVRYLAATGSDAVLIRYVIPLALHYLRSLNDLDAGNPVMVADLASEVVQLATATQATGTHQIAVSGIIPLGAFTFRDVFVRPLDPLERGSIVDTQTAPFRARVIQGSNFVTQSAQPASLPRAVLEVTTARPFDQQLDPSTLLHRVVLSFFLHDVVLGSSGSVTSFDNPQWASFGYRHTPGPLSEKPMAIDAQLSVTEFERIVELAYTMPELGSGEGGSREIALQRTLRGCGTHWRESGFLDFVIALEAALLKGANTELSYKFALYGALFLRTSYNPGNTFKRLRNIYTVRSKLVHGAHVEPISLASATADAAELSRAIMRQALESGWPDHRVLDEIALGTPLTLKLTK